MYNSQSTIPEEQYSYIFLYFCVLMTDISGDQALMYPPLATLKNTY